MDDPQPKRKPGRPRVEEAKQGINAATWLEIREYDTLCHLARKHDVTISALLRSWIRPRLKTPP